MKLLVVGAASPSGKALISLLRQRRIPHHSFNERQLDDEDPADAERNLQRLAPDQVLNLAPFKFSSQHAPQLAERAADACRRANQRRTAKLAQICGKLELPLLQLSTPYVFDGEKKLGYNELDDTHPVGVYGTSAWQGELAVQALERHLVLRTGWLFGPTLNDEIRGWLKAVKRHRGELQVVRRRFSPTPVEDLARVLLAICQQVDCDANVWGTYHYCGLETKKESEFVLQVLKYASQHDEHIYQLLDSVDVRETQVAAPEVPNSTLGCKKIFDTFGIKQRSWHGSLQNSIKALYQAGAYSLGPTDKGERPWQGLGDAQLTGSNYLADEGG
ncbi:MAG: hypothetical protein RLZZ385_582 [Pseudomonadota bacterium]